jgi:hypothetical protein
MGTGLEMPRKAARRNVARIAACREVSRIAARGEVARIAGCREVSRIAARGEVARIAGCRDLIRRLDQQGAARHRPPEPHNHAHKMRREPQSFRQKRK